MYYKIQNINNKKRIICNEKTNIISIYQYINKNDNIEYIYLKYYKNTKYRETRISSRLFNVILSYWKR